MKKLSIDVEFFRDLITEDYLYVDKTEAIYDLVKGGRYYFLSRPRRFGKSLLISTLEELFSGNRELFKGLWIDSSDYDWPKHPVISLDFSSFNGGSPELFEKTLSLDLRDKAADLGIDLSEYPTAASKLKRLVQKLAEKNKVVVLIDEYDAPLISNIDDLEVAKKNLKIMNNFFAVLKSLGRHLRAIFITGVSKFSKANVFSGLNNLNDISLDPIVSSLLGYTEEELSRYFSLHINQLALTKNVSEDEIRTKIRQWYNGYQFSRKPEKVFNPFSVQYLFQKGVFANYWFETATPTFLVKELAAKQYTLKDLEQYTFSSCDLGAIALGELPLANLLFQTGYLTISGYDEATDNYALHFPNLEVKESLLYYLFSSFSKAAPGFIKNVVTPARNALEINNMDDFCVQLAKLFAYFPYQIRLTKESHYHSFFQLLTMLLGFRSQSEVVTDKGRIDLVVETERFIYIFEIKLKAKAETALKQIEDRRYYERYLAEDKKIVLVGISFLVKDENLAPRCAYKIVSR